MLITTDELDAILKKRGPLTPEEWDVIKRHPVVGGGVAGRAPALRSIAPIIRAHQQISGYRLIKRRGRGGVAEVWEAESPAGYRVALKLVHLSTDLRSGELRALKITREIRYNSSMTGATESQTPLMKPTLTKLEIPSPGGYERLYF